MISEFEEALRGAGFPCRVEVREKVAVIAWDEGADRRPAMPRESRDRILGIARDHGFTHVALELTPQRAPLPGHHP
jgi:hypothetical protein